VRYEELVAWSDKEIRPGDLWHTEIKTQLESARAAVLLVSPAFLASDYIARSEVPVLLKRAKERGLRILPVIVSPCLYEETRFKYPDWKSGPDELMLGSLQSINPPSRTLVEMTEGEQNRVFLTVARQLDTWLKEDLDQRQRQIEADEARREKARIKYLKDLEEMRHQIEVESDGETSKHVIVGEICTACGNSVAAIAHFKWFRCQPLGRAPGMQ